ncbi:MAG: imidazoleglycerol-phosphate dehydratase HisB [Proteobacteria bacterium]|nr:imidazoleglycerol-phosphate dehydratase HisB [Pseudomonadota bacterium]MBU1739193.1 imidazoleglycerol-phosphate dehydratase HisB [Pseudomonadota bacterium]
MSAGGPRKSTIARTTKETSIQLTLELDGTGQANISTGVPFLDHMLTLFTVHGFFNLTIAAKGDTEVDDHHTVEDLGICLGQAFRESLGNFGGIMRYGHATVPMDETLARTTVDISNRPYLYYGVNIKDPKVGTFDTALGQEFLRALSLHAGLTLHVEVVHGENAHHQLEAIFKALGRSLDQATTIDPRVKGALSSKGSL